MPALTAAALWTYSRRHDLLAPGRAVLVGVSGGPDSLALLDLLHALAEQHGFPLAVGHFDHGLRPESAEEAAFVRAEADQRGRPFFTERGDTAAYAAENKLSTEAAARYLRYAFLARAARQADAGYVAVAHTQDDQAETVLMHFLRGSGLAGLRGMQARSVLSKPPGMVLGEGGDAEARDSDASPLILIRPLLATAHAEVEAYCAEHGLQPRHDPSNADTRYTRNRLRHEILPILERENPNLRATLARTAEVMGGEYDVTARHLEFLWAAAVKPDEQRPGQVVIQRGLWAVWLPAERLAMLRQAAAQLLGDRHDLDFEPLDAAARFASEAAPGRSCEVARGLHLAVDPARLVLYAGERQGPTYPLLLDADGALPAGWHFVVEPIENPDLPPDAWEVAVPTAALTAPLIVRTRRPGDRFQPIGMGGQHMKLSDFFINLKIAAPARDRWPIVVCGDAVAWVAGLRLDQRFAVKHAHEPRTRLRFVYAPPTLSTDA